MKIFVTGASGFIGKNLVKAYIKNGQKVTVNLREGSTTTFNRNIKTYCLGKKNIEADIEFFKREKFDGMIHLASLYLKDHKPEELNALIDSNVKLGSYLLECASKASVKWFVNTGSFWQNYQNHAYSPVNLYAATKQAFEAILKYYTETNQILACTLKLSDTFGPNDTRPKIFNLWERIANTNEVLPMSLGGQLIDINHINNVIEAFITLSNHLHNNPSIINNGIVYALMAEKRYTLKELSELYERVMNIKLNIAWGDYDYRNREVMVPWENGNPIPGYSPVISIEEGLKTLKCQ